ncbi:AAA family ATPase [Mycoplasmatota bacterium zrk1]
MILSYVSTKGGVGTSTLASYNAHYLAREGKKVLYISMSEQGGVYDVFGCRSVSEISDNVKLEFLIEKFNEGLSKYDKLKLIQKHIKSIRVNIDVVQVKRIFNLELKTVNNPITKQKVKELIAYLESLYDYIVIDYPKIIYSSLFELLDASSIIIYVLGLDPLEETSFEHFKQVLLNNNRDMYSNIFIVPNKWESKNETHEYNLWKVKQDVLRDVDLRWKITILNAIEKFDLLQDIQLVGLSIYDENILSYPNMSEVKLKKITDSINQLYKKINVITK